MPAPSSACVKSTMSDVGRPILVRANPVPYFIEQSLPSNRARPGSQKTVVGRSIPPLGRQTSPAQFVRGDSPLGVPERRHGCHLGAVDESATQVLRRVPPVEVFLQHNAAGAQ